MTTGADSARDIRYGRRGNRWTKHTTVNPNPPKCEVCGGGMHCRQPRRHWSCAEECGTCHRPVIKGRNCQCKGGITEPREPDDG